MYGQGNYAPQFGQGSQTSMPQFQQHPVAPLPPPFQQYPPTSQPSIVQHGPPSIPPNVGHSGHPVYQHAPPPVQQVTPVQVPTREMLNAGQPYLLPRPPHLVHGSTSTVHSHPTVQHNSQWTHNIHHIPSLVPPPLGPPPTVPSRPEIFRPSLPPRVIPTLLSQGQTPYRGPIHQPQQGIVQGTHQIPLPQPPPPPSSSFFTPAPFGFFVHSAHQDSNVLATGPMPPPPPPSSPPPLPPCPPPPVSPLPSFGTFTALCTASDSSHNSESGPTANHSGFEVIASDSVDKVVISTQIRDDVPVFDDNKSPEYVGSPVKEDLLSVGSTKLGLPPPPPKPVEEKVVQKIEVLCHFIAKKGPGFEDMARQKESGNPEFDLFFGGEPGSEAAVAHEYFEWMKKKCLACKLQDKHSNSVLRPSDVDTSRKTNYLIDAGASHSHSESDMDMEDDITQPDEEQRVYTSFEDLNHDTVLIPKELDTREQLHAPHNAVEYCLVKDTESGSSGLAGQEKRSRPFLDHDNFACGRSLSQVDSSVMNLAGAAECPSNSTVVKSSVPPLEDLSRSIASAAASGIGSDKFPDELIKGASPFRLLQDYASDDSPEDDDKPRLEDVSPVTASPLTTAGATSLHGHVGSNFQKDQGSKGLSSSEMAFGMFSDSIVEISPESQRAARETNITSVATVKPVEIVGNYNRNQESIDNAACPEALQGKYSLDGVHDAAPESGKSQSQKEDVKYTSSLPKVDEFGRLVREGASDSDSDESHYTGGRGKRGRSWSRSQSPHDRRRRRSRQRRKEKQSWSPSFSWSPKSKKQRSRSRSLTYRCRVESGGDKMRRGKDQLPECCHRGAFCWFMHHDSVKSDGVRQYRSKQQFVEVPHVPKTLDSHEEIEETPAKRSAHEQDVPGCSVGALKDGKMDGGKVLVSLQDAVQTIIYGQDDRSLVAEVAKSERSREVTAIMQETRDIKEEILESTTGLRDNENCLKEVETAQPVDGSPSRPLTDIGASLSPCDTSNGRASLVENLLILHSQANLSLPVLQHADHLPQHADVSSSSDCSRIQTSKTFQNQLPVSEPHINKMCSVQSYPGTSSISQSLSSQSLPLRELTAPMIPPSVFPDHNSQLIGPLPSLLHGAITPPVPQLPREHNLMQPTSKFSSLSSPMESCPPQQGPLQNQHSHFPMPPNSSWSLPPPLPLPPQPPFVNNSNVNPATAMQAVPLSHFQHNQLPPRNNFPSQTFLRPFPSELPAHSQVVPHRSYPLLQEQEQEQEPPRPSSYMEDFRSKTLRLSTPTTQPFGGTGLAGEDHFSQFPVQGSNQPNLYGQGNVTPQSVPSLRDSATRRMQSFLGGNLPSGGFFTSSSQNHPFSQQQRPLYGLDWPATDGLTVNLDDHGNFNSTMSRYTSHLFDKNQPSHPSDFGGSRISNHYNPYASTFDQPLSSKFRSNVLKHEKDMLSSNLYDASYSLGHAPVGHGVGSLGSRCMTSSPKSARAADLPISGGDQYDPLFDSIEPPSNSFKKFDHDRKHEPTYDAITLRLDSSCKPLDVEENKKQKDVGVVTAITFVKSDNDEYRETADAEAGDVENASASNPLDVVNTAVGEIVVDQVKMPGKSKKSKDSRSMKLFKVAVANFVKEVLKPLWRQGNMSKEAFKTIVKKTVDKVSGAMKSHQIPKSQAKVYQYIDSSQRKLTKLVMGYVEKYVKYRS